MVITSEHWVIQWTGLATCRPRRLIEQQVSL